MKELTKEEILSLVNLTLIAAGNETPVMAAGLAVVASDTERVLMLQRSLSEDDPAAGKWEFPGGTLDDGETPNEAAIREWTEETGVSTLPTGKFTSSWTSANGIYELFVYRINKEADLDINLDHEDRDVLNPDDPDGDNIEVIAWWSVDDLINNPALRAEVLDVDWRVLNELPTSISFENLLSMTLIDGEDVHYHWDPETQFYNQCHDERGRFCEGPDGPGRTRDKIVKGRTTLRDSDGKAEPQPSQKKTGPLGGSLVDPNAGTDEFDGLKGYAKNSGKPVPGSDAWLEAHGMSREIFESRPYVKFEPNKNDPALLEAFERGSPGAKQWDRLAEQKGQEGGYIMYKKPIPDSPYGPIDPQVRPNKDAVTNYADLRKTETRLANAKQRYKDLKDGKITPQQLVAEQKAQVKKYELNLERTKKATPEIIRAEAQKGLEDAKAEYAKAKASKDPDQIQAAKKNVAAANREIKSAEYKANKFKPESAIYHAQKQVDSAKQRLAEMQEDPKAFHAEEIIRQGGKDGKGGRIGRAMKAVDGASAKYLFTRKADTARIDMNQDPQNVKNLMNGKGRIYFAMEGSIKNDAILAAVKREDPTAAVVNVPSVTLWHNKSAGEGEIQWFARTHGKGRQIVLIPDADGVYNVNVMRQANALATSLKTHGADQVLIAAPPVKHGTKFVMDPIKLPSGAGDKRKGIDDHLGAGRGTLGQLAYRTDAKLPKFSLNHLTREGGNTGDLKLNRNALNNHESVLSAISGLAGSKGAVQVSGNLLKQTAGLSTKSSTIAARDKLADLGIIELRYVFDKDVLARSRKRVPVMSQKEVDSWVKKGIIKPPPEDLYAKDDYEASPIIVIKDSKYIVKDSASSVGILSDLPDWKPPKSYDGWRSPLTGRRDTTGQAARMAQEEAETLGKRSPSKGQAKVSIVQTAEQRAKTKKAPPGRKIVRTEEGAKRYGVPIGSIIPLSTQYLGSMVLLSSVMTEEELQEFYNQCHDENGRFCEGDDGPGRVRDKEKVVSGNFGPSFKTVAKARIGSVEVDGIKAKAVYEIKNRNGDIHRLYDKTGEAKPYAEAMLQSHARMGELYPLQPPRNIVVAKADAIFDREPVERGSFATVYGDSPNTYVNSAFLGFDVDTLEDGFQMSSAKTGNTSNMDYLLKHEYGHHLDFAKHSNKGYDYRIHPLTQNEDFRANMSRYGNSSDNGVEAYAEAFADWHHSAGTTTNPASIAMARYEGWRGANSMASSGEIISLTLQELITLQDTEIREFPEDSDEDINSDIPKTGIKVIDTLEETGAILKGGFKAIKPSEKEMDKANKIMAEVLKELGMEGKNE